MPEGTCAKCGSTNLSWETNVDSGDEQIYYPYVCDDCGYEGKEWYKLVYIETE